LGFVHVGFRHGRRNGSKGGGGTTIKSSGANGTVGVKQDLEEVTMTKTFNVIVVGARCAGSTTAMLLARAGYRVLVVDRATFPSDTVSTHLVHPLGIRSLSRWGLLDRLTATGCPPIHTYSFDFGSFTIAGAPGTRETPVAYCPRRTVLDKLLVDAATEAGAEVREGFTVEEVLIESGCVIGIKGRSKHGDAITERAEVVVGADGRALGCGRGGSTRAI
jgi:flavin-dependent dehydrogenase